MLNARIVIQQCTSYCPFFLPFSINLFYINHAAFKKRFLQLLRICNVFLIPRTCIVDFFFIKYPSHVQFHVRAYYPFFLIITGGS